MMLRVFLTATLAATTLVAAAQPVKKAFTDRQKVPMLLTGVLVIDNPVGNVEVIGADVPELEAIITRTIVGADEEAVEEGRRNTVFAFDGDARRRIARAGVTGRTRQWSSEVAWRIVIPRKAGVHLKSHVGKAIRIRDVGGAINIMHTNGTIVIDNPGATAIVETTNGSIYYKSPQMRGSARLMSINGHVTAVLPETSNFRWVADSLVGDIRTTFPARGAFFGTQFRASVNSGAGPTLTTIALMGNVHLIATGAGAHLATSVKKASTQIPTTPTPSGPTTRLPAPAPGDLYRYSTNIGDVRIPQILGNADIFTGAGFVQLGAVTGNVKVQSNGGPMQFGEVDGVINATTRAGDVLVDTARRGGFLSTAGGTIRVLFAGGPLRLQSGGGDLVVRQATSEVHAETRSGDILIVLDRGTKTEKLTASTQKGSVTLQVSPRFGADVDATIETTKPNEDAILSDIPGLTISRQQLEGGRVRIHATGKLNGGGERMVIQSTDGGIRITTGVVGPSVIAPQ